MSVGTSSPRRPRRTWLCDVNKLVNSRHNNNQNKYSSRTCDSNNNLDQHLTTLQMSQISREGWDQKEWAPRKGDRYFLCALTFPDTSLPAYLFSSHQLYPEHRNRRTTEIDISLNNDSILSDPRGIRAVDDDARRMGRCERLVGLTNVSIYGSSG